MKKTLASFLAAAFLMTVPALAATSAKPSASPKAGAKTSTSMKSSETDGKTVGQAVPEGNQEALTLVFIHPT